MIRELNATQRRLLAVGLLLLVLLLFYELVARPLITRYQDNREQIAVLEQRLASYRAVAANAPALKQQIQQRLNELKRSGYFLKSTTPALASAELQDLVRGKITQGKGHLFSSQAHETTLEEGYRKVVVDARMRGDMNALQRILFKLVTSRPLVFVDELVITGIRSRVVGRIAKDAHPDTQLLDVRIKASAYMASESGG